MGAPFSMAEVAEHCNCHSGFRGSGLLTAQRDSIMWGFPKTRGTLFWGPYNKDPTIWCTILGSPIFGNPHVRLRKATGGTEQEMFAAGWLRIATL